MLAVVLELPQHAVDLRVRQAIEHLLGLRHGERHVLGRELSDGLNRALGHLGPALPDVVGLALRGVDVGQEVRALLREIGLG